jgi:PAS domain S-box-containing protein
VTGYGLSDDLYAWFLLLAVPVQAWLALRVWRRRPAPGATALLVQLAAIAVWCSSYALEILADTPAAKVFWAKVRYVGVVFVPLFWLAFASRYTRRASWLTSRTLALLAVVPLLTLAFALTNGWHHWLWQSLLFEPGQPVLRRIGGPWYRVSVVYSYTLFVWGTALICRELVRTRRPYRMQNVALLVASLVPFAANWLYVSGRGPLPGLDLTPLGLSFGAFVFAWCLLKAQLLDLIPVARDAVVEGLRDGVLVLDGQGRIVDLNPAAERMIGFPSGRAIGMPLAHALPPAASLASREPASGDRGLELGLGDGDAKRWYEARASTLRDDRRHSIGRLVVLHDVTERRATEHSLAQARDHALQATKAKSDFLATISHEIRTPMNAIIGMTDILLESGLDEEQLELAGRARNAAVHLLTILNDILDFSKMEAGKLEIELRDFDLGATIEEAVDLLAEKAQTKGLELVCAIDAAVPGRVVGDAGRLRQALLNLLANAVKFTERGEIVVRASLVDANATRSLVRFEVADTGIGIPLAAQGSLFESFSQVDASSTSHYGGTGLGLAIVKRLVQLMGGQVGVESEPGKGSAFWFTVPLLARPTEAPSRRDPRLAGRALCVDDSLSSVRHLVSLLSSAGLVAEAACSGEEALSRMRAAARAGEPYNLVVVDLHMPGMSGIEVMDQVHRDATLVDTPLVLLTPFARLDPLQDEHRSRCATLRKPVHRSALLKLVATAMDRDLAAPPPLQASMR